MQLLGAILAIPFDNYGDVTNIVGPDLFHGFAAGHLLAAREIVASKRPPRTWPILLLVWDGAAEWWKGQRMGNCTQILPNSGPCYGGLTFKNRGHLGSRYILNLYPGSPKTKERMVFL